MASTRGSGSSQPAFVQAAAEIPHVRALTCPPARSHACRSVRMCSPTGQGRVTTLWSVSKRRDDADARCTAERWPSSLPARMQSPVCDALPNVCQAHKRATAINMPINAEATWGIICGAEAGARVGQASPACGSTSPSLERGHGGSEAAASQRHVATRARAQQGQSQHSRPDGRT